MSNPQAGGTLAPDPSFPIRGLVRVGGHHPRAMQGKVYWWRQKGAWEPGGAGFKSLPGNYMGEAQDAKPWSHFAYPVEIIIDPTDEQIAEENRKLEAQ